MSHAWLRDYGRPYFEYGIGLVHAGYHNTGTRTISHITYIYIYIVL